MRALNLDGGSKAATSSLSDPPVFLFRGSVLQRCITITVPGVSAVVANMVGRAVSASAST